MCSISFCASQFPVDCPSGPTSGGKGFGGHTTFTCDGADEVLVRNAEYGGGSAGALILFICCGCALARYFKGRRSYDAVQHAEWPQATNYVSMGQPSMIPPVAQPVYGAGYPGAGYPGGGGYPGAGYPAAGYPGGYGAPPAVYVAHQQPPPTIIVTDAGHHHGGHHGHGGHHHGGGHHREERATHSSGGF